MTNETDTDKKHIKAADPVERLVITRRDYFAAAALTGLIANSFDDGRGRALSTASHDEMAEMAVNQADAILKKLEL